MKRIFFVLSAILFFATSATPPQMIQPPLGRLNLSHPLCKGLSVYYPMNEGGGFITREVVKGLDVDRILFVGDAKYSRFRQLGGLLFDGNGDLVETNATTTSFLPNTKGLTVSCWYKHDDISNVTGNQRRLINHWDANRGYILQLATGIASMQFGIDCTAGGGSTFIATTAGVDITTIHNVVCTYDGANVKIYIDGVLKNSAAETRAITVSTLRTRFGGAEGVNQRWFEGYMKDVMVWGRALSETEIMQYYSDPYQIFLPDKKIN